MSFYVLTRSGAAAIFSAVTFVAGAVQEGPTTATKQYNAAPGTRLVYETSASLKVSGDVQNSESGRFQSVFTVLEQRPDGLTLLAEIDRLSPGSSESTSTAEVKPAARFTLMLPAEGAVPEETVQTAGFAASPFKGWEFESIFPPVPADGATSTSEHAAHVGEQVALQREVKTENGVTSVRATALPGNQPNLKYLGYQYKYSGADSSVLETSQTTMVQVRPGPGVTAVVHLSFETQRKEKSQVSPSELENLKKDVAAAVPLATRIRSLGMAGPDALEQALTAMDGYLKSYPEGSFAPLYQTIQEDISRARAVQENSQKVAEDKPAPDFEGKTLQGDSIKLSGLKGKVVLLDFWATWCAPCVAMVPDMKRLYDQYKGKPFEIIGISADHEESILRDFVKERELGWPQIYEGEAKPGSAMLAYGIQKFPTTVLIDAKGQIRKVDAHGDELSQAIDELLREAN